MNSSACSSVLYIFQLPAISGVRRAHGAIPGALERRDAGQRRALDQLQRRPAAGREVVDRVLEPEAASAPPPSPRRRRPSAPGALATASATRAGAGGERLQLEGAHRPVPEDRPRAAQISPRRRSARARGRCPGPSSPPAPRRRRARGARRRPTSSLGDHEVHRQQRAWPCPARPAARAAARGRARVLRRRTARRPPRGPARTRNGKHIAPPIRIASASSRKRSITRDLVVHLGSAEDRHQRAGRALEDPDEAPDLGFQQPPGGARQQVGDPLGARVRAVGRRRRRR